ncbi:hypothetical protein QQ045_013008 [Rhodiola kirilowii]
MDNRKPKRSKSIFSYFQSDVSPRGSESTYHDVGSGSGSDVRTRNISEETVNENLISPTPISLEDRQNEKIMDEAAFNINSLERDPEKRQAIWKYPLNEQDNVRRAYVVLGANQPHLKAYPSTWDGGQYRKFNSSWFEQWQWLEYSIEKDKAFCFACFLFEIDSSKGSSFTSDGFSNWRNVKDKKSGILAHMGGINSIHNSSMQKWENLRNPSRHIERVINTMSSKEVADNRLRLITTIEAVKFLSEQGCPFRGNDESVDSLNRGNFDAVLKFAKRISLDHHKVLNNAPKNAKYTSSTIQKQMVNILANKVRAKIREEVGESKFCILVDEALDVANKEKMAIILRFVDCKGLVKERFFKLVSVVDTRSQTLKDEISRILAQYDLNEENMRGQGYDGASNMSGQFNGLQALFLKDCPYAYYVHCFAHRLQLTLNYVAKEVPDVWQFFSTLTMIVNFVDSSAKRHSMLKSYREEEILDLLAVGTLETGTGMNQSSTLQRSGATRWGSHLRSIASLIKLFGATMATIDDLYNNGVDKQITAEAKGIGKALKKFNFVYCLLLMHEVMMITEFLSQAFQKKEIDILNAIQFLSVTKRKLQTIRDGGWDSLIMKIETFCLEHGISMPDMSAPYKKGARDNERNITNEHYFRVNILYAVIDLQLMELEKRFPETSMELLGLGASFDPRHDFQAFKAEDVCKLASKFYPCDFTSCDMDNLKMECGFFVDGCEQDSRFTKLTSISDLCRLLVESGKSLYFPMIYRLICLILTLPVSTATTERAFSSMKIIKNDLRNKLSDEFLDDLMVVYIERTFIDCISNDDVIAEFEMSGPRRVKFS